MEGTHYPIVQQHSPVQVLATLNGGNVIETIKTFTSINISFYVYTLNEQS